MERCGTRETAGYEAGRKPDLELVLKFDSRSNAESSRLNKGKSIFVGEVRLAHDVGSTVVGEHREH